MDYSLLSAINAELPHDGAGERDASSRFATFSLFDEGRVAPLASAFHQRGGDVVLIAVKTVAVVADAFKEDVSDPALGGDSCSGERQISCRGVELSSVERDSSCAFSIQVSRMAFQNSMQAIQSSMAPLQSSIFPIQRLTPLRRRRCGDRKFLCLSHLMDVRGDTNCGSR